MAELLLRNQALEQETLNQRHIIQLEKLKTEKESKDLELQRNQLMDELEQEKRKLEEDISQLSNKKVRGARAGGGKDNGGVVMVEW